jgi:hypothetical protein
VTTPLDKTLKRELKLEGQAFIVALSPEGLKITLKGKRKGQELRWTDLISGDAALAVALNASLGKFSANPPPKAAKPPVKPAPKAAKPPAKAVNSPPKRASKPRSKRRRSR